MSANPSPKVSVIVPIYKVEQYLMPCLETIVTQTLRDLEIILVDEGDHDVCYAIMKLYEAEDSRVKVIHQKCGSYGNAVNLAIDAAQGEYIAIVEPDDLLEPTMYEELYKIAREADADIAKCSYSEYREEHGTATKRPAHEPFLRSVPAGGFTIKDYPQLLANHASVWAAIYRSEYMRRKNIRFAEGRPSEYIDVTFRVKVLTQAAIIACTPKNLYNWRLTNPNSTSNNFSLSIMLTRWKEVYIDLKTLDPQVYKDCMRYSLVDQYRCCFSYFSHPYKGRYIFSERDFIAAQALLAEIDKDIIESIPVLDQPEISRLLWLKTCPSFKQFTSARPLPRRDLLYRCLRTNINIKHHAIFLQFLAGLHRTLLRLHLILFQRLSVDFLIGKDDQKFEL